MHYSITCVIRICKCKAEKHSHSKSLSAAEKQHNSQWRKLLWAFVWLKLHFKATASFNKGDLTQTMFKGQVTEENREQ